MLKKTADDTCPPWLPVSGVLALGLGLRLLFLNREGLWYDEALTALSMQLPFPEMFGERLAAGHSPLYFMVLYPLARVFGTGEVVLRLPSVLASVLSVYVLFQLARCLFVQQWVAHLAALLFCVSALNIYFAQEARMYALCILFAILSFYYLHQALDTGGWPRWVSYGLCTVVLFYLSASSVPLLLAQAVFVLVMRKRILPFLLSAGAVVAGYFPMIFYYLSIGRIGFIEWLPPLTGNTILELFYGFGFRPVPIHQAGGLHLLYLKGAEMLSIVFAGGLIVFGVVHCFAARKRRDSQIGLQEVETPLMLSIWFFLPLIGLTIYSHFIKVMLGPKRYVITLVPAYYLLISLGVSRFPLKTARRAIAAALLILFSATLIHYYRTPTREDWRGAVAYLEEKNVQGEVVFGNLPTQVMYRYYGDDDSVILMDVRYLLKTNFGKGWILLREQDYASLSPYLAALRRYYTTDDIDTFYGLRMIRFWIGQ